ncbi:MAG: hypothetical protein AVDCRST_MAG05-2545, partial [uncultured Rubrobacteraceae bacterium]
DGSLKNGAEKGLGPDAQDPTPAHPPHPPASTLASRTLRPTTNYRGGPGRRPPVRL